MMKSLHYLPVILFIAYLASACSLAFPVSEKLPVSPEGWRHSDEQLSTQPISNEWWHSFGSAELNALINAASADSYDIAAAIARVERAEAQARIAGAALLPEVTLAVNTSRQDRMGGDNAFVGNQFSAAFNAGYEIDFWGRNRAARDQAVFFLQASRHDRDTVRLTVTTSVAQLYIQTLGLSERLDISRLNLANAESVLRTVEARYRAGAVTQLDVAQQRGLVAEQKRNVASLEQQVNDSRAALAILLTKPPVEFSLVDDKVSNLSKPEISPGIPSQLLVRRPDIALAEANLKAADANIVAARAAMLPRVDLSGSLGVANNKLSGLFDNTAYSVAAGLLAPIFNAGRLAAGRDFAIAQKKELLHQYHAAILNAFGDVETALNAVAGIEQQSRWQQIEVEEAERAFRLAEVRYRAGAETLLTMLDAQRTLYRTQDNSVQLSQSALQARVNLYKALGGGWARDME